MAITNIIVSSDVLLTERTGYALLKCGTCPTFLLINSKDFEFTGKWSCLPCASK